MRPIVMVFFIGLLFTSLGLMQNVKIGLDQKLSMPKDSYVLDYFESLEKYLSVGVPVYFVIKQGPTYEKIEEQNLICSGIGCNKDSMLNQINIASLLSNYTKIAVPTNSWIDDYFDWLSSEQCCRVFKNDSTKFCPSSIDDDSGCESCSVNYVEDINRPQPEDFYKFLPFYLIDNPGMKCAKGGHAAYGGSIEILSDKKIGASYFMTYSTLGITSTDFINSLKNANEIAANITQMMKTYSKNINDTNLATNAFEVFPYRFDFYSHFINETS